MNYPGIPKEVTLAAAREWVEPFVSKKRFNHIKGVAKAGRTIAQRSGVDGYLAELAGWLHDACKEVKDKQLVTMAKSYGLDVHPIEEENGHLLHGPVGAQFAAKELGISHKELLNAIAEHTLGAVDMTPLSKVVFLADCLEESRPDDYTAPIWEALENGFSLGNGFIKAPEQEIDMDAAMLVALDLGLQHLLESKRAIHPKTVDVRNYFLKRIKQRL